MRNGSCFYNRETVMFVYRHILSIMGLQIAAAACAVEEVKKRSHKSRSNVLTLE